MQYTRSSDAVEDRVEDAVDADRAGPWWAVRGARTVRILCLSAVLGSGLGSLAGLSGCEPLIRINPETGKHEDQRGRPLCERVVDRMIRCSTDPAFRDHLRRNRKRAVKSCEKHGTADAKRCVEVHSCDYFVRCLRE
jgi:hypothetical protein